MDRLIRYHFKHLCIAFDENRPTKIEKTTELSVVYMSVNVKYFLVSEFRASFLPASC